MHCFSSRLNLSFGDTSACLREYPGFECREMADDMFLKHSLDLFDQALYTLEDYMCLRSWLLTLVFSQYWDLGFRVFLFSRSWNAQLGYPHCPKLVVGISFSTLFCPFLWCGYPLNGRVSLSHWVCEPPGGVSHNDNKACELITFTGQNFLPLILHDEQYIQKWRNI